LQNDFGMKIFSILAALATVLPALTAGPVYRIEDLGSLGGSQMSGMAINQLGQVAGYGLDALGTLRAFSSSNSLTDITPMWASTASASGLTASGQIVGSTFVTGHSQATLWSNGTAQVIGGLGGPDSYAMAINDGNQIAGMATTPQGQGRAVIYSNGGVQDVSLPGSSWASAYGINASGAIAGYAMNANGVFQAYTWSPAGGYTSLGTLGGRDSYAFGINNQGQVAGNSNVSNGYAHAFIYDGTGLHDLGTLGGSSSYAYGINDAGSVVGYSSLATAQAHAFILVGGILFDLNSLVSNLTGWELTQAYAINNSGQLTGTGLFEGVEHAFRLDPASLLAGDAVATPEPATYMMMLAGSLLLIGGSWLKRRSERC
jgi:probable HAF family extracellular repeat protein